MYAPDCVRSQKGLWCLPPSSLPCCLGQGLSVNWKPTILTRSGGRRILRTCLPLSRGWTFRHIRPYPTFYVSAEDLNSDSRAYTTPIELALQLQMLLSEIS